MCEQICSDMKPKQFYVKYTKNLHEFETDIILIKQSESCWKQKKSLRRNSGQVKKGVE